MSEPGSLSGRSAAGAMWVAAALGSQQGIQLLSKIVLARILLPEEFGLSGMAGVVLGTLGVFLNLGFASALVYRRDRLDEASDTAFWILPLSGALLTAGGFALAGPAAAFFGDPEVAPLTRVLSLSLFVSSLSWVSAARIARAMAFRKTFYAETANAVAYGVVAIPMALSGYGAMSLAWGWLAGSVAQTVVLWFVAGYRPRLAFHPSLARELFTYGGAVMSSSLAAHLIAQIDVAIVGRLLGSAALGYYALALQAVTLVLNQIVAVVRRVAFPAFAEVQSERARLEAACASVLHLTALLVLPAVAGTAMAARWLIPAAFGPQWTEAIPLAVSLAPMGASYALRTVLGSLLVGVGQARIYQATLWAQAVLVVGLGIPAARSGGLVGLAAAVSAAHVLGALLFLAVVRRRLGWPVLRLLGAGVRPAAATAIMVLALAPLHAWGPSPWVGTPLAVVGGAGVYALALWRIDRAGVERVRRWLRSAGFGPGRAGGSG